MWRALHRRCGKVLNLGFVRKPEDFVREHGAEVLNFEQKFSGQEFGGG